MAVCKEVIINGRTYLESNNYLFSITDTFNCEGKYNENTKQIEKHFYNILSTENTHLDNIDAFTNNLQIKDDNKENIDPRHIIVYFIDCSQIHYHTVLFWRWLQSKKLKVIVVGNEIPNIRYEDIFFQNIQTCDALLYKLRDNILALYSESPVIFSYIDISKFSHAPLTLVVHHTTIVPKTAYLNKNFLDKYSSFTFFSKNEQRNFQKLYGIKDDKLLNTIPYLVKNIRFNKEKEEASEKIIISYDSDINFYIDLMKHLDNKYKIILFSNAKIENLNKNIQILPRLIENYICALNNSHLFITLEHCYYTHFNMHLATIAKAHIIAHKYYYFEESDIVFIDDDNFDTVGNEIEKLLSTEKNIKKT